MRDLRLVAAFFDELRRLGRYDSATIVLHADTGHGIGFLETEGERSGAKRWAYATNACCPLSMHS